MMMDELEDLFDEIDPSELVMTYQQGSSTNNDELDHGWNYCNFTIHLPHGYWNTAQYPNGDPVFYLKDTKGNNNYFRLPQHRISLFEHLKFDEYVDLGGGRSYGDETNVDIKNKSFSFYYENLYVKNESNIKGNRDFVLN